MEYEIRRIDISLENNVEKYIYCRYKESYSPMIGIYDKARKRLEEEGIDQDEKIIELVKKNIEM